MIASPFGFSVTRAGLSCDVASGALKEESAQHTPMEVDVDSTQEQGAVAAGVDSKLQPKAKKPLAAASLTHRPPLAIRPPAYVMPAQGQFGGESLFYRAHIL